MAPPQGFVSEYNLLIPTIDLLSFIYEQGECEDWSKPLYYDADNQSRHWNKRQSWTTVRKLAAGLRHYGLQLGDCVLVHSFNDINFPLLVQGVIGAGGVFNGSNPSYTTPELVHQLKTTNAKFLITEPEIRTNLLKAAQEVGIPTSRIWILDNHSPVPDGLRSWHELLSHGQRDWVRLTTYDAVSKTTACRLMSSGTTGLPKAVELTHYNLIAQHIGVMTANRCDYQRKYVIAIPMFLAAVTPFVHFQGIHLGYEVYILRRFEMDKVLQTIQEKKITELAMVPAMVILILMDLAMRKYDLSSLRTVTVGAAPLNRDIQQRFRKEILAPGTRVVQGWGMTETCCIGTLFFWPEDDDTGSIGRPINKVELLLVDKENNAYQEYDKPGELLVRGPTVMPGYYKTPDINAQSFRDKFFRTGDICYCSSKTKKWYIVGREKELIKVRGFQVAPIEVEGVLMSHPSIVDAAVIGVPGDPLSAAERSNASKIAASTVAGELVRAYIILRPGEEHQLDEKAVLDYTSTRLASFKRITGGVVFIKEIPKNANGKILRRVLMEEYERERKIAGTAELSRL